MTTTDIPTDTEVDTKRVGYIAGLRQLANLLERHDDLPLPYEGKGTDAACRMTFFYLTDEDPKASMVAAARALPGRLDKVQDDNTFRLFGTLGGGLHVQAVAYRSAVCERVVTGVETVTETVPDPEALAAVPTIEVTHEVEQIEWRCHPLLADDREQVPA